MIEESRLFIGLEYGGKPSVWNPLEFTDMYNVDETSAEIDVTYITSIEADTEDVCSKYTEDRSNFRPELVRGFEVGDDNVSLSNSIITLARIIVMQERVLKMKTSWKDTYISEYDWNFCEVTSALPCSKAELFSYCSKTGRLELIGFNDYPPLRIIGNVTKGDKAAHSSTVDGKASLLGRKLSAAKRPGARELLHVASWLQDGCLRTTDAKSPKYLPGTMGGSGCPDLWDNPTNTLLYVHAYKFGEYLRVYGTAVNELKTAVAKMDRGEIAEVVLCRRLRQKQEYLHITYAGNVMVPESDELSLNGVKIQPLYKALGAESLAQGIEGRLLASRRVITRHRAEVELLRTERISLGLFGFDMIKEKELLLRGATLEKAKRYGGALRANAAVSRLLEKSGNSSDVQRLLSDGFLLNATGVQEMSKSDVIWLSQGGKGDVFTIHDIPNSEDIFIREEVSLEESLKVPDIGLRTVMSTGIHYRTTVSKVGLWQITEREEEWADQVVDLLTQRRAYGLHMTSSDFIDLVKDKMNWVNDDGYILSEVINYARGKPPHSVVLASSDIKLGKRLRDLSHLNVVVVHPEVLLKRQEFRSEVLTGHMYPSEPVTDSLCTFLRNDQWYPAPRKVFLDTGSISSYAMRMEENKSITGHSTGVIFKYDPINSDVIDGLRCASYYQKVALADTVFAVYVCSSNGNNRKVPMSTEPTAKASNPASRIKRFSSLFSKRG